MSAMRTLFLISSLLVISACSGGSEDPMRAPLELVSDLREEFRNRRTASKNEQPTLEMTRALLDTFTVSVLEVRLEGRGRKAILLPAALRTDQSPGQVTVWKTFEEAHVILRDGVLYATRGLGRDLASSDTPAALRAVNTRAAAVGARSMRVRNDVNGTDLLRFQCEIEVVSDTTLEIVERRFAVRHLQETCRNSEGFFVNDYWVDSSSAVIQSRQWAGPHLGFMSIQLLKK